MSRSTLDALIATIATGTKNNAAKIREVQTAQADYVDQSVAGGVGGVSDGSITNAKLANVATATFKGRNTSGTGSPEDITVAQVKTLLSITGIDASSFALKAPLASPTFTGTPIVPTASPGTNTTQAASTAFVGAAVAAVSGGAIADGAVTNAKLANVATATFKGRSTSGTGSPEDLTVTQVKTILSLNNVTNTADTSKSFTSFQITDFSSAVDALVPIRNFDDLYFQGDGITTAYTVIKADVAAKVNPRVLSVTSSATVTPNADTYDAVSITAQAVGLTLANWAGTPLNMQAMIIRVNDNGSAQSITYGPQYRALGVTLPTTTVANKTLYLACMWNSLDSKIDVIGTPVQA
jgi:hypothetical protein